MKKIGELNTDTRTFVIYYDEAEPACNRYKLYIKWYNVGWHRKLLEKYARLSSCTNYIHNHIRWYEER